jgi:hypothetical protein
MKYFMNLAYLYKLIRKATDLLSFFELKAFKSLTI